jgi:hypothetical protein
MLKNLGAEHRSEDHILIRHFIQIPNVVDILIFPTTLTKSQINCFVFTIRKECFINAFHCTNLQN